MVSELGVVVRGGVSKKLDLLVVKDPLVSERVFWNWLGVQVT